MFVAYPVVAAASGSGTAKLRREGGKCAGAVAAFNWTVLGKTLALFSVASCGCVAEMF